MTQINLKKRKDAWDTLVSNILHDENPIILSTEPYFNTDNTLPNINSNLVGYYDTNSSGTPRAAIIIHTSLVESCSIIKELTNPDQVAMTLDYGIGKVLLLSTYMDGLKPVPPPGYHPAIEYSKKYDLPVISCSDSNSHHYYWGSPPHKTDKRGEILLEYFDANDLMLNNIGKRPTFVNSSGHQTHIDLTVSNDSAFDLITDWRVSDDYSSSDHRYIKFNITVNNTKQPKQQKRLCKNTDWDEFDKILKADTSLEKLNPNDKESLEHSVNELNTKLTNAFEATCPLTHFTSKVKKPPWLTPEVEKAKAEVKHILKLRKPLSNRDKNKPEWLKQREKIAAYHKLRKSVKSSKWKKLCSEVETMKETCRMNKILQSSNNKTERLESVKTPEGTYTDTPKDTLDTMIETHFNPEQPNLDPINIQTTPPPEQLIDKIYSLERLDKIVKEFSPDKAAGPDGFQPLIIQKAWKHIRKTLQKIMKCSHNLQHIPSAWQEATGIFIAKPGKEDYSNPKSFRTITLTQTFLKIQEKAILWHITNDLGMTDALNKRQHGFRKGSSTTSALHKVVRTIEKRINKKGYVLGTFLDIEGAFDNVSFDAISRTLNESKLDTSTANWITAMVTNRYITINHKNTKKRFKVCKGCPQGGILSPFLWNLILDDLLNLPPNAIPGDLTAFADDLTVLVEGNDLEVIQQRTQTSIKTIETWCQSKGLNISALKTKIVMFTNKRKWSLPKDLTVNNTPIELADSAKLLGVTLDSKLNFNKHIDNITRKATMALMQCRRAIRPTWGLPPNVCKWIYTAVIRPVLTYACTVWINALKTQFNCNKLERVHRLALNTITGAFPNTPSISLNKLSGLPHILNHIRGEAAKGAIRLQAQDCWTVETPSLKSTQLNHHSSINKLFIESVELPQGCNLKNLDLTRPAHILDKLYTSTILDRDSIAEAILNIPNDSITAYTDGSKSDEGVGFGYIITTNNNQTTTHTASGRLPDFCDTYQAELTALTQASYHLHNTRNRNIVLLTDSCSSIQTLQKITTSSKTALKCHNALNTLAKHNTVEVTWVPGHSDYWGNEQADTLAKDGIHCSDITCGYLPFSVIKRSINHHVEKLDEQTWDLHGTRHTKLALNEQQDHIKTLNTTLGNNRKDYSTAIRLMTGVVGLNYHLHKIKLSDTDACPQCSHSPDTVSHFLGQCPAFTSIRGNHLQTFHSNTSEIFENNNLMAIIRYTNKTKRLQYDPSKHQQGVT